MVGVTGGVGSGKSTVCSLFRKKHREIISADLIANELTETNPAIRRELRETFGKSIYQASGSLDRRKLADIAFRNPTKLRKLNRIVHPRVLREVRRKIRYLPARRKPPFVVVEAALIFEAGFQDAFDAVILVDATLERRIKRVKAARKWTRAEILRRARMQLPSAGKRKLADFIIRNNGTRKDLANKVDFIDSILHKYGPV